MNKALVAQRIEQGFSKSEAAGSIPAERANDWLLVKLPMRRDPWPWLEELIAWNVANGSRASIGEWPLPGQAHPLSASRRCGGMTEPLSPEMVRLIIAARIVAFEDQGQDALKELDAASEAFADQVPWEDEP